MQMTLMHNPHLKLIFVKRENKYLVAPSHENTLNDARTSENSSVHMISSDPHLKLRFLRSEKRIFGCTFPREYV
jgi:hypothetical protein